MAVWNGQVDAVSLLMEAGTDLNARDKEDKTVLQCFSGIEIQNILIAAGAR